jgi:hypothetical protein
MRRVSSWAALRIDGFGQFNAHLFGWVRDLISQGDKASRRAYDCRHGLSWGAGTNRGLRGRAHKFVIMQIRRGLPAGALSRVLISKSPGAPAGFSAAPGQIVLGQALASRVNVATRLTAEAAAAAGLIELASRRFARPIHDVHNLMTRAIARFLMTGQGTTDVERDFIGRLGVMAARYGLSLATLTRSYLLWRDTNLRVLNEEISRLGIAPAISDLARMIIRSSADTGIMRMAQAFDSQSEVSGTLAPNVPSLRVSVPQSQERRQPQLWRRPASEGRQRADQSGRT